MWNTNPSIALQRDKLCICVEMTNYSVYRVEVSQPTRWLHTSHVNEVKGRSVLLREHRLFMQIMLPQEHSVFELICCEINESQNLFQSRTRYPNVHSITVG